MQLKVKRYPENPLITPADVPPYKEGWEVMCAFNAGVIEHNDEIILLMRVAEKPKNDNNDVVLVPVLNCETDKPYLEVLEFSKDTEGIWLGDPRVVCFPDEFT